jgi:hypothetical protein
MQTSPMKELQILLPDGNSRLIVLVGERLSLGRSSAAELCYPDDKALSKQHLAIERDGDGWALRDLGSRNGTMLNGAKITERTPLRSGDRIIAGHLIMIYDDAWYGAARPVVVFDAHDTEEQTSPEMVITQLEGVIKSSDAIAHAATHVSALVRAGNELAGHRPLPELFRFILELSIQAVNADRGLLMTLENGVLVVQANQGQGFRISTAVRDRVLDSRLSVLVRDTSMDDALRGRRSIEEQNIRTLMAVPLQTRDQIIGIIYVDSPSVLREFTRDDLDLLTVMANVAAIRIEHTRFAEVEQARQLMARELEQAAEIQKGFLPSVAPSVRGLDVAGHNAPCRTVGGGLLRFLSLWKQPHCHCAGGCRRQRHARIAAHDGPAGARSGTDRRTEKSGRGDDAAEPHHLRELPTEPVHHRFLLHPRWRYGRTDILQCWT